jgi:hypothetical protein
MNLTTLQSFCGSWGDLSTPFYHNHFVYATDGNLAVRLPAENLDDVLPVKGNRNVAELAEKLDSYFVAVGEHLQTHLLSDFDFDEETEICEHCEGEGVLYACAECEGSGEVSYSTDYHGYESECYSCGRKGYFTKSEWVEKFRYDKVEFADTEDCGECGGEGSVSANPDIYINEMRFQGKLLKRFMQFEGATIAPDTNAAGPTPYKPALITWSNGQGILMPMRDTH